MPKDIVDGSVDTGTVAKVSEQTALRLSRHQLRPRTIVLPRRGEITKRVIVRNEHEGWLCGTGCLQIFVHEAVLVPEYLYYFMEQDYISKWLEQHAVGTTMLNLSGSIVAEVPIRFPAPQTQTRIASILSTYDSLLENNRRRMKLLEESARLLFQEWFVRLRFPGHERVKVKEGVPAGWEKRRLADIAEINRASLPSGYDGEILYVDIASVTPGSINEASPMESREAPSRAKRIVAHGDTIWSCVRPNRRSHAIIWNPLDNLIVSTGFAVLTPTAVSPAFLYYAVTTDDFVGYLENHATGAAYPAVVSGDFARALLLVPPEVHVRAFEEFASPVLNQIKNLHTQNQKLKTARDLLLPRLMSGELVV